jgi:LmbE family N-acetylglucosaminyl deacetylase
MNMERILVVAAHPDDDVLGCGGTLRKLVKRGKSVRVVFLGEGSTCRFSPDQIASAEALETIEQRTGFARESLAILGIENYTFHNLPCGRFDTVPIIEIGKIVEKEIADFQPDTVFSHFAHDTHVDHRLASQATLQATRPVTLDPVRNVISFEILSSTEWRFTESFNPNFFVDIHDELSTKIESFSKYITEERPFPFPRSPEGLTAQATMRGMQVGCASAEAFVIVRSVEA